MYANDNFILILIFLTNIYSLKKEQTLKHDSFLTKFITMKHYKNLYLYIEIIIFLKFYFRNVFLTLKAHH